MKIDPLLINDNSLTNSRTSQNHDHFFKNSIKHLLHLFREIKEKTMQVLTLSLTLFFQVTNGLVAFSPRRGVDLPTLPSLDFFKVVEPPSKRGATVIEAPVSQDGVNLYIAIDSDSFDGKVRPGNGGIRLLNYQSANDAIDDAVRLAKGMTRKHDMFRTGFSGAKVVVNSEDKDLNQIERKKLMEDAAEALKALDGTMYTGT